MQQKNRILDKSEMSECFLFAHQPDFPNVPIQLDCGYTYLPVVSRQ